MWEKVITVWTTLRNPPTSCVVFHIEFLRYVTHFIATTPSFVLPCPIFSRSHLLWKVNRSQTIDAESL